MKIYALYNIKGGVGKTSSAVNFAWLSARDGARTLLWDLDPQGAATYTFRIRPRVDGGAEGLLEDSGSLERSIRASDYEELDVLPSDFAYRSLDLLLQDKRRRTIARLLAPLREQYDRMIVDCAPGLSVVTEQLFRAADALLVPTIPTVLSLRTLAKLLKHLKKRNEQPRVVPFFCMVDRRKSLHRRVCAYAVEEQLGFPRCEVPYASVVEQMGVRRQPLPTFAASSAASRAYGALWAELVGHLEGGGDGEPSRRGVKSLLRDAEESARPVRSVRLPRPKTRPPEVEQEEATVTPEPETPDPTPEPPPVPDPETAATGDAVETEFKLALSGAREADLLCSALVPEGPIPASRARQVNHFFDDATGSLRAGGMVLRLREEDERYFLTAKGPVPGAPAARAPGSALSTKSEEEVAVSEDDAAEVLAGERSPLKLLTERLAPRRSALVDAIAAASGDALVRVGSFRNERTRIGPLHLAGTRRDLRSVFELDRTEFPGGRVDHEVELEVDPADAAECGRALRALFDRVGLPWRPSRSKAGRFFEILDAHTRP